MSFENEYTLRDGINYRNDGTHAFCDRCGYTLIFEGKCLKCDVQATEQDLEIAAKIKSFCFSARRSTGLPGSNTFSYERFDTKTAASMLAVLRAKNAQPTEGQNPA